ncbi:hypothetical protein ACIBRY_03350 [Streptomyces anulatus]
MAAYTGSVHRRADIVRGDDAQPRADTVRGDNAQPRADLPVIAFILAPRGTR